MSEKRYLILAEEFSHDPHYAKTARGVMRYRRDDVVAMLDSKRAGESEDGVPIVGTVDEAPRLRARTRRSSASSPRVAAFRATGRSC